MNGRHVLFLWRHFKFLIKSSLVNDAIVGQIRLHIKVLSFSLPGITFGMDVNLFVAVQNLENGLLFRDFKLIFSIAESVDDSDELWLFGQLSNAEVLVFPPRDGQGVVLDIKVKIFPIGNVELLLPISIDKCPGASCLLIKPMGDVSSSYLDDGVDLWKMPILLDESGEVVYISEEDDPNIIGGVVGLEFWENVVSFLLVGLGD